VTLGLSSSDGGEGTVSPASLTFTTTDWSTAQTVTVTGVNDDADDGDVAYTILTAPAVSADTGYNNLDAPEVSVVNQDNDVAGVTVVPSGGTTQVAEGGATDTYTVVLNSQPTANVVITVSPDSQVGVNPASLTFTASDWSLPQTVSVTAVDDTVSEGPHAGLVTHSVASSDGNYHGLPVDSVAVTVADNNDRAPTVDLANAVTTLAENTSTASRVKVADIAVTDDGLGTNLLSLSGADAALFEIAAGVLYLTAGATLDYETNPVLDVTVAVDDATLGGTPDDTAALAIAVVDANEPPTVALANAVTTLAENTNTASSVKVADITVTDDDLGSNALSLAGVDAASFVIVGMELHVKAGVTLDFEGQPSYHVTVQVDDTAVGATPDASVAFTLNLTDLPEPLQVTSLTPNPNGFRVAFNRAIGVADLNLYDSAAQSLGAADMTVVGATVGLVRGSLILSDANRQVTFVRTGGPLAADTYTVTLRSAANGFREPGGELLDGNADGTVGDDYSTTFTVTSPPSDEVFISIPDFARGYGQPVNLPRTTDAGIPVTLSTGQNVSRVQFDVLYDPALLTITGFTTDVPSATPTYEPLAPGLARFTVDGSAEFSSTAGSLTVGRITATVPDAAPYASKQVLDVTNLQILDATAGTRLPRPARDDDGVHVAAYFGDTTGNGQYSGSDVTLLQRVVVGSASGFAAYQLADPGLIADLNGSGTINGSDVTFLQRVVVGTPVSFVPALPSGLPAAPAGGPDPRVWIPTDLRGVAGQTITVPVNLTVTEPAGITLSSVDLVVGYDAERFTVDSVRLGTLLQGAGFSAPIVNLSTPGIIRLSVSTGGSTALLPLGTTGSLVLLELTVQPDAAAGPAALNLRADFRDALTQTVTGLADGTVQDLVLSPAPTNADTDAVDGLLTVAGWHNGVQSRDVNGDGRVTPLDVLLVINYLNAHPAPVLLVDVPAPPAAYYDVNQDQACTPLDALLIINYLNTPPVAAGEGERAGESSSAERGRQVDRVLEEWDSLPLDLDSWLPDLAANVART
jgi:hypothetical protein